MNFVLRGGLWLAVDAGARDGADAAAPVQITASDNREALIRLSTDPLTIQRTRVRRAGRAGGPDGRGAGGGAAAAGAERCSCMAARTSWCPKRRRATTWRALPRGGADGPRIAYYPDGYHLLLRDHDRAVPIGDIVAWMRNPSAALPSGAERAAEAWLEAQD